MEQGACSKLRHGCLNCIFELDGVSYQPCLELIARAMKKCQAATAAAQLPPPKRIAEKQKWKKLSSRWGDRTSKPEKALAKPVKQSKKFSVVKGGAQFLGLSIHYYKNNFSYRLVRGYRYQLSQLILFL
jgi:hypothetical protein